ncbi:uncharacterized protein MELLADRAFT_103474 [Melampsora larici-populina 98AG31]|uniref:Uncharacterized protein n=1 Tax=Melampsora larici-populina (strain 98AG31 / pathotype 3-4-7) TaxID=747676 RepID=F4RB49_MELLP|nr:uncharacterized protein MELLADRAFT_103474 [Melampsora larici-populina 98AG31]EGG10098.1 hypothetical protein MELLADRAFT_103474 [Melampsora larici-populina 98AG31]
MYSSWKTKSRSWLNIKKTCERQKEVDRVSLELGSDLFRNMPDASGWDPKAAALRIDLVTGSTRSRMTKTAWEDCTGVLRSLYHSLLLDHARLVFRWDIHLLSLLHRTQSYCGATIAEDSALELRWKDMLRRIIG